MFDFATLRGSIAKLTSELRALQTKHDDLCEQRRALDHAMLPKADVVAAVDAYLDHEIEGYGALVRPTLEKYFGNPKHAGSDAPRQPPLLFGQAGPGLAISDRILAPALLWACRDSIREALHAEIDRIDFASAGLPFAKRDAERQRLDKEISALEAQIEKLQADATAAGLRV